MLDDARRAVLLPHDLHCRGTRSGLHGAQVRGHDPRLAPPIRLLTRRNPRSKYLRPSKPAHPEPSRALSRKKWKTRVELANAIFKYIEIFYNRHRRRSGVSYRGPIEYETLGINDIPAASQRPRVEPNALGRSLQRTRGVSDFILIVDAAVFWELM